MPSSAGPDFLAIGHVAKDLSPEGFRLGGAVTYAAVTGLRMSLRPAVVTSVGPDLDLEQALPGIAIHVVPSPETTTFLNTYPRGVRSQVISATAGPIGASDVPAEWHSAPRVLLGPLVGEVSYELARSFPHAMLVASIQGWLRRWDRDGRVDQAHWPGTEVLPHVDAAVVSRDDFAHPGLLERWAEISKMLIVTEGSGGARLYSGGEQQHIAAFPTTEVDPTGAGDVFAAAYLIRYLECADSMESARFASCAASFCVEAEGVAGIPTRAQVEARLGV